MDTKVNKKTANVTSINFKRIFWHSATKTNYTFTE